MQYARFKACMQDAQFKACMQDAQFKACMQDAQFEACMQDARFEACIQAPDGRVVAPCNPAIGMAALRTYRTEPNYFALRF
jgi:hypothetical protein